jgi:DUF177 domain-containing protein
MKIDVNQISEVDGLSVRHLYPEGKPSLRSEDSVLVGRTEIDMRAGREGEKVRLAGVLKAKVQVCCDRCLKPSCVPIDQTFDLLYIPPLRPRGPDDEKELGGDDLSIAFYQDGIIDLDDVVREQVELELPMSRLCSEDCLGLCPECGANLNEWKCSCSPQETDPRWAALRALKSEEHSKG